MMFRPLFILIALLLHSLSASALIDRRQSFLFSDYYQLRCEFTHETYGSVALKTEKFYRLTQPDSRGRVHFQYVIENLPSYYFVERDGLMQGVWHNDARMTFRAELANNVLNYYFSFENYIDDSGELLPLKEEHRQLYLRSLSPFGFQEFNYEDGELLMGHSNVEPWVNEDSASINSCVIERLNLLERNTADELDQMLFSFPESSELQFLQE